MSIIKNNKIRFDTKESRQLEYFSFMYSYCFLGKDTDGMPVSFLY